MNTMLLAIMSYRTYEADKSRQSVTKHSAMRQN